jgi:hypothetical protein
VATDFTIRELTETTVVVEGYSKLDPQRMPIGILSLLPFVDGRPLEQVKRDVMNATGVPISDSLLIRLIDVGVLVPV